MPPPSLLSLLPAASISPRTRRRQAKHHKSPTASHLLCSRRAAVPSPLQVHASFSSSADGGGGGSGGDELHLLEKPSPSVADDADPEEKPEPVPLLTTEEALAPFLKFFQVKSTDPDAEADAAAGGRAESDAADEAARPSGVSTGGRGVRYYDPKPGDLVAGVVVRSDDRTLDVDIGAGGEPALMLSKEAAPAPGEEFGYLACDVGSERAAEFAAEGRVGVVVRQVGGGEEDVELTSGRNGKEKGAPVTGVGAIVFAEVLGRTLGGRPLLSARRLFRRVAWHRVRQVLYANPFFCCWKSLGRSHSLAVHSLLSFHALPNPNLILFFVSMTVYIDFQIKQLNVPIKVKIYEWNAGGLLSRIEGLRAFLPKPEMMARPRNFTDLKNKVGQEMHVCITRIDEGTNELIISEKEAWIYKLLMFCSGLLHMSNITHGQLRSVADVLKVGETVKALVIKSTTPDRIALSTKDLESEPGLFITNKEKVFFEAEEMAQRYREQIGEPPRSGEAEDSCNDAVPFDNEAQSYANWKWLKFSNSDEVVNQKSSYEF
ncbi:hypothetical protein BAE44_0003401 [Dichanthelium oligosanthes]|uniref:S1 motif domain-containing protein n=1 Tax=Dichanthelium oligosanthes TaxID=888268 RepID=A0A1E5WDU3_9POAL|nr:hypothetical protein BAE44_0003401 [Dichanthelium oligosanthes]